MPLSKGSDPEVVSRNIAELVRSGYPRAQAVAIALKGARKHRRKRRRKLRRGPMRSSSPKGRRS